MNILSENVDEIIQNLKILSGFTTSDNKGFIPLLNLTFVVDLCIDSEILSHIVIHRDIGLFRYFSYVLLCTLNFTL